MTPELTYFLKINVAIALFYAFYRLFFYKDTFFHWRRIALLSFFAISLLYPLLNIQEWIKAHEPMVAMADLYATIILPEQTVTPQQEPTMNWQELTILFMKIIYWSGVLFLATRFLLQLGSIIRLHIQCSKSTIQGTRVHLLKKVNGPFSFFRWIFIYPQSHTESEISEIITHEETHARQYHSVDVLISELMCTFCWFNPFIWLMKREVRGNLEYMADHRVLETGHDSKSYQYHLLGLAHHKAAANLSNSFNVLPLKNRIKMMNKRRTKEIGRTKYLMFLPLAALLMIVSNIEMVARTTEKFAKEVMGQATAQVLSEPEIATIPELPAEEIQKITLPQDKKIKETMETHSKSVPDSVVFEVVEEMPDFPGGMKALMEYLSQNIKYPAEAHAKGIQGRVIVSFIVKKDGSISDIKVVRSVDPYLDKEAERVIAAMPAWKPGKQRGQAVNVRFTVPVAFRLTGPEPAKAEEIKQSDLEEVVVVGYGLKEDSTPDAVGIKTGDTEPTFKVVETMPKFPGGTAGLMKYLARNIKYPTIAQKNKEQGRVIIKMVVGKDGSLSDIKVLRSVSPSLDAEAIRVVGNMPKWEPGQQRGQAVAVEYTLPIVFRLQ
ncbi:MAG: TonB family protein [Bacteroides acidifaciens]|uniref:M56 family metallopeptidase n=1 Tax=Bacteroides acidifaciens TaxID=85831 RepID=UPI0023D1847A|nr:M56 family metallopeptidase [Bacteroides acidifaciens]MDE6819439.1 TonB family protein [Bacteroides acidifaciens]MDE6987769.1 TonB family protein [Bacteroides acidifaciens]